MYDLWRQAAADRASAHQIGTKKEESKMAGKYAVAALITNMQKPSWPAMIWRKRKTEWADHKPTQVSPTFLVR